MATSLQQQLAVIAEKSTHQLDLRAQRGQHSKSLLFDSKHAANQTFDTIFQICAEGFGELCALDARFVPFSRNLFSEQSKNEERTQMTAKENEELDTVVKSFLALVGAKVLLKPGLKAVEWLVRRFRVHEYNTEPLVLTFLPYHTNPVFATVLSILPKTLPPSLKFLQPYITSLTSPPRQAILYAAINNPGFFSSLNQYSLGAAREGHQSATSLGFWASITAQAINGQLDAALSGRADVRRQREEDVLLRVVPVLQDALRIRNVPELFLGSCMIITILVSKTQLEDKVLDGLMDAIVRSWSPPTVNDGLACLSVIAEERRAVKLPKSVAKALLAAADMPKRLGELSERLSVGRLYLAFTLSALEHGRNTEAFGIVDAFLAQDNIASDRKRLVIGELLSLASDDTSIVHEAGEGLAALLQRLSETPSTSALVQKSAVQKGIDIGELEVRLQVPLRLSDSSSLSLPDEGADEEMTDVSTPSRSEVAEAMLAALPASLPKDTSFLDVSGGALFTPFQQAFLAIIQSKVDVQQLIGIEAFQKHNAATTPAVLSFLTRAWSSRSPAVVKAAALRAATNVLKTLASEVLDMQALLPYVLVSLADSAETVRRAASDLLIIASSLYHTTGDKGKVPQSIKIWGHDKIYGQASKDAKWLSSQDAYKFISSAVAPNLEECVLDANHVQRLLAGAINVSAVSTHGSGTAIDLKSALRASIFTFLSSQAAATPVLIVRARLLSMLAHAGKAGSAGRSQVIVPALQKWIALDNQKKVEKCSAEGLHASDIDHAFVECLSYRTTEELDCLKSLAAGESGSPSTISVDAFHRLRHLWPSMKLPAQESVATFLLDASLHTGNDESSHSKQAEAVDVLRQVSLPTEILVSFLAAIPDVASMQAKPPAAKRRRTSRSESAKDQTINTADLQQIVRRLTLVLELIESSKPEKHPELLKGLFHVLGELQYYRIQLGSDLVYLQQMVIGCLLSIVNALKSTPNVKIDRSTLRADLIVECVRSSSSTQVHNAALLLISSLASWVPDLVLHSVMPIFTFMSTTLLRQSDDYSAHIIDQTVSQVVPPLVTSLTKKNQDLVTGAAEMLLSFTAAFEHIPLNRRLRLFSHLVRPLGPDDSLHAVVAMLLEKYPTDQRVPLFVADLMNVFSPFTQLSAAMKYLDLVSDALLPKRTVSEAVFGFNDKSAEQIQQSLHHLLASLARLLHQRPLHAQITKVLAKEDDEANALRSASALMLEKSMTFSKSVEAQAPLSRASGLVLAASLDLLPTIHFIRSAGTLLDSTDDKLRLMVLQSLEQRAGASKSADQNARDSMLGLLPKISGIVAQSADVELKHSAIACIDQLAEKYGKKDADAVFAAAQIIASEAALASSDASLRISSLLCLSSMVDILRDDMVPLLPASVEKALEYLQASSTQADSERLHDAVYTFFSAILDYLPWIFSSKMLSSTVQLTYQCAASSFLRDTSAESREQFCALAARKVDCNAFLSALDATFDSAVTLGFKGANALLSILGKIVTHHTKSVLMKNSSTMFSIINRAFDLRRVLTLQDSPPSDEELQSLDDTRDAIVLDLIMKLNDALFRPFFVRLVDWAMHGLPKKDVQGRSLRCLSLYKFLARFFESLKSIVTSYSSYLLEHAATTLNSTQPSGETEQLVLGNLLDALSSSFKHDQDEFWQSPSHFTAISSPLLAQLSHAKAPAVRDALHIIPTITELAAAAASPEHHKELNGAILKYMRADDALVRLAAVKCEQRLTDRLGEDWLALLPEMLPFISELQEDDDEVVERETLAWIRQIEAVLGESLEGMLQ